MGTESNEVNFIEENLCELPGTLNLNSIVRLNLHGNLFHNLQSFKPSSSIRELNLSSNVIKDSDISEIIKLSKLEYLDLSANILKDLISLPFHPGIRIFKVAHNDIRTLTGIKNFPNLEILDIRGNKLSSLNDLTELRLLGNLQEIEITSTSTDAIFASNKICRSYSDILNLFSLCDNLQTIDGKHKEYWCEKGCKDPPAIITPKLDYLVKTFRKRLRHPTQKRSKNSSENKIESEIPQVDSAKVQGYSNVGSTHNINLNNVDQTPTTFQNENDNIIANKKKLVDEAESEIQTDPITILNSNDLRKYMLEEVMLKYFFIPNQIRFQLLYSFSKLKSNIQQGRSYDSYKDLQESKKTMEFELKQQVMTIQQQLTEEQIKYNDLEKTFNKEKSDIISNKLLESSTKQQQLQDVILNLTQTIQDLTVKSDLTAASHETALRSCENTKIQLQQELETERENRSKLQHEVDSLRSQLQVQQQHLQLHTEELKFKTEKDRLDAVLEWTTKYQDLKIQNMNNLQQFNQLEERYRQLEDRYHQLEDRYCRVEDRLKRSEDDKQQLQVAFNFKVQSLNASLEDMNQQKLKLQSQLELESTLRNKAERRFLRLHEAFEELSQDFARSNQDNQQKILTYKNLMRELTDLTRHLKKTNLQFSEKIQEYENSLFQASTLTSTRKAASVELVSKATMTEDMESSRYEPSSTLPRSESHSISLPHSDERNKPLTTCDKQRVMDLLLVIRVKEQIIQDNQVAIEKYKSRLHHCEQQLHESESQNRNLEQALNDSKEELRDVYDEMGSMRTINKRLRNMLRDLSDPEADTGDVNTSLSNKSF